MLDKQKSIAVLFILLNLLTIYSMKVDDSQQMHEQESFQENNDKLQRTVQNQKHEGRTISFRNYQWSVRSTANRQGPGPNYYSDSTNNVYVDGNGNLNLKITKSGGNWQCAQINLIKSYGYGVYAFTVQKGYENIDPNAVIALFTYLDDTHEIDIEISKWGNRNSDNTQYVVQPGTPQSFTRFSPKGRASSVVHAFHWTAEKILFQSFAADSISQVMNNLGVPSNTNNMINQWTYYGPKNPRASSQKAIINFWLASGNAPQNGQEQKVVIKEFKFFTR